MARPWTTGNPQAWPAASPSSPAWVIAAALTGRGMAIGLILTPLLDALLLPLPAEAMDDATTVFNIAQRLGGSIGIAALGSVYAATGFRDTIWVLAALAALGLTMIPFLPAGTRPDESQGSPDQPSREHE
jgi:predicted MFS family arabinose efflux permease